MKVTLSIYFALLVGICEATAVERPVLKGLRELGNVVRNKIRVKTGLANTYEKVVSDLRLRKELQRPYASAQEFCETLQAAAPTRMLDGIEAAANNGDCDVALTCLHTMSPNESLGWLYRELLGNGKYMPFMCLLSAKAPTVKNTPVEEFLDILEMIVLDPLLPQWRPDAYPLFTAKYDMSQVVGTRRFKRLIVESMKSSDLTFLKLMLVDYSKTHSLTDLKFAFEGTEIGLLRAIFQSNPKVQQEPDQFADLLIFLSKLEKIPLDDMIEVIFDMDHKGLISTHWQLLTGSLRTYVHANHPETSVKYDTVLKRWVS